MAFVNALDNNYVNYIVQTDTHYTGNTDRYGFKIANYLYSQGKFDKLIHLGDLLENDNVGSSDWEDAVESGLLDMGRSWLFTQGNHDNGISPISQVDSLMLPSSVHYVSHSYHNAYYYDNSKAKIRFVCMHHYLFASSAIRTEVESWVSSLPSGWKWCLLSHYPFKTRETWNRTSCMTETAETWLYGLINTYGNFIATINGHLHTDAYDYGSTGSKNYHQINLDDDLTTTSVSIISINTVTQTIKLFRIGNGTVFDSNPMTWNGFTS